MGPLQNIQVTHACRPSARQLVPRTAVVAQPLQQRQVAPFCGHGACVLIPISTVGEGSLYDIQVPVFRRTMAHTTATGAAVLVRTSGLGVL